MKATKFREISFWAITFVNLILCLVSFWTSKLGLDTTTDNQFVSTSVAFAGASFAFVFWFVLSRRFPAASRQQKVRFSILVLVIAGLLFGFSTQWSVITLGGKEAVSIYMQKVLEQCDAQGLELLKQGSEEANLGPQMSNFANQFEAYAKREGGGAYSGVRGEGPVTATLRNTSETFASLANSLSETENVRRRLYEDLKKEVADARDILTDDNDDLRVTNLRFSKKLARINEILTRMSETSSLKFVTSVNRKLAELTTVDSRKLSKVESETIKVLQPIISAAQDVIRNMTDEAELINTSVNTFTMLSMSRCVLKYFNEIFYAWAYALALDFAPFLFIILLAIARPAEEMEITFEQAEAARASAENAYEQFVTNAKLLVANLLEEHKSSVSTYAEAAMQALESQVDKIVRRIRNTQDTAMKDIRRISDAKKAELNNVRFQV